MAKITFIQDVPFEAFGIEFISSYLKSKGHGVDLIILNQEKPNFNIIEYLEKTKPDLVGFSITTIDHAWSIKIAREIKKKLAGVLTIFGGAHPTMFPDFINEEGVDIACAGEGEYALEELMSNIDKGITDHTPILNLSVKYNGKIVRNRLRNLISNHDEMPFPDREVYYKYPLLRNMSTKKFFSGRGCPYHCTYCNNHYYQKLFQGLGKYVTYRSPEKVIQEIKQVKEKYGFRYVYLAAETLTTNHEWLTKFLTLYKKEINVPFSCLSRVNELNEDIVSKLAIAGCFFTSFGLESGNERIRNTILKRNMKNEQIVEAAQLLHKYGIKFLVHQIMALPTETLSDAFETIDMDIKIKADSTWTTIFQALPGTEIYSYCVKNKLFTSEDLLLNVASMYAESKLKQPQIKEISNLQKLVYICVKFPWLLPMVKWLIKLPPNPIFDLISKWNMLISYRLRYRLGYIEMFGIYYKSNKRFG